MNNRNTHTHLSHSSAIHHYKGFITRCLLMFTLMLSLTDCKKKTNERDEEETLPQLGRCEGVTPAGRLNYDISTGIYSYRTSGGGTITINSNYPSLTAVAIKYDSYPGFYLELWGYLEVNGQVRLGASHESLIGKHIKDRIGDRRTIILPDGAKVTLISNGPYGAVNSVSIYDLNESHHINLACNKVEYSSPNESVARRLDDAEADGETAGIEITATGLVFVNLYTENTAGDKVMKRVLLGELFRSNPNTVTDYYDDPRLMHT